MDRMNLQFVCTNLEVDRNLCGLTIKERKWSESSGIGRINAGLSGKTADRTEESQFADTISEVHGNPGVVDKPCALAIGIHNGKLQKAGCL
jgi:hypothetical protein